MFGGKHTELAFVFTTGRCSPLHPYFGFPQSPKLVDFNCTLRENSLDSELSSHRLHNGLKRAQVHVCTTFELRNRGLFCSEQSCQVLLRHLARSAQFVQRHFRGILLSERASFFLGLRGHLAAKFMEILCHVCFPLVLFRLVRSVLGDRQITDRQLVHIPRTTWDCRFCLHR